MRTHPSQSSGAAVWSRWRVRHVVLALALVATILGALQLAFLCDDAYITFRYVSNARDGHGLVWNAPPFLPVEGYTGFAWAMLLWATWSWFGIEPPAAANVLSIACGVVEFAVIAAAALRLRRQDGSRAPDAVGLLALVAIVGNRSFLQWLTSGLETALFNAAFVAWVLLAFRAAPRRDTRWLAAWAGTATLAALTRPDGLLLVAATVAASTLALGQRPHRLRSLGLGLLPVLGVVLHVGWRRWFYGEWLPNTYYAKVLAAWPEAGLRHFACFAVEHGVWLWAVLAAAWLVVELVRARGVPIRTLWRALPAVAAVGAVLFHSGYYVFKVGGDHFEYRVFSQLVPLLFLSAAAMALRLSHGLRLPLVALGSLFLASTVGWVHLAVTGHDPKLEYEAIAPRLPAWLSPLTRWYDRTQGWLQHHFVCLRCNQHTLSLQVIGAGVPPRRRMATDPDDVPVYAWVAIGLRSWVLPDIYILDLHGLNDWIVARLPQAPRPQHLQPEAITPIFLGADADGDGWLTEQELDVASARLFGAESLGPDNRYPRWLLMLFAEQRRDALSLREARTISDQLFGRGLMAHERHAPPDYVQAFAPNVTLEGGAVRITPRATPLTPARIVAIENEWRQKARGQNR